MEFKDSFFSIILSKLQVDYTQMEIPIIKEILNTDFLGFNQLDYNFRIVILIILSIMLIRLAFKLANSLWFRVTRFIHNCYLKYKSATEQRFNTLVSTQVNNKLRNVSQFIIVCNFDMEKHAQNKLEILNEFSKSFLINQEARVKYEKDSIIFKFDDFYNKVNGVVTQLYLSIEIFKQKYSDIKIYSSAINIEKEEQIEYSIEKVENINRLKISTKFITCDTTMKFYYDLVTPQLYEFESKGEYLLQKHTIELYTMISPVDRTL